MAPRNAQAYAAAIAKKLNAIPAAVKASIKAAQDQNADEMVGLAKSLVPKKTGALEASIHKETGPTELSTRVVAGDKKAFYARFVEFGTRASSAGDLQEFPDRLTLDRGSEKQNRRRKAKRSHPGTTAQPYFFPAYRALKKRMKGRVSRAASKAVKTAAAGQAASAAAAPTDDGS